MSAEIVIECQYCGALPDIGAALLWADLRSRLPDGRHLAVMQSYCDEICRGLEQLEGETAHDE